MKTCPYCAESIQEQAVVCKHCKSSLTPGASAPTIADNPFSKSRKIDGKKLLKAIGIIALVVISFSLWYITIPLAAIWYLWKKAKFSKKTNSIATVVLIVVFIALESMNVHAGRAPSLTITAPQNNYSVQAKAVSITGKVDPAKSILTVNEKVVAVNTDGAFSYQLALPEEKNAATVKATNNGKVATTTLSITRIFTEEEKAERAQQQTEAEAKKKADAEASTKAQAEADAKAKADQAAYERTKPGQICKKHPSWAKQDCERIANNEIWIGMHYEMVVEERGKPDNVNQSNYGAGNQYQLCWSDYTPSCFYTNESDGLVKSYN